MRRYVSLIFVAIVLILPFALRWVAGRPVAPLAVSGATPLIIISPHQEAIRREFREAFARYCQQRFGEAVELDFRNYGGSSDIVRYFESGQPMYESLGTYNIDLIWGGGDDMFERS